MLDEIVNIEKLDIIKMIDIEVNNNHLFYANNILTHNSDSDFDMTNTSESFGLPYTVDFMVALIPTDELMALNQIMFKQLKNRYADVDKHKRFVVGIDKSKMRLYDVEETAQKDIVDDKPVFDKTEFFEKDENKKKKKFKEFL